MIVFNASTLILLAKVELLDTFLGAADEQVVIPREVERECCEAKRTPDALVIQAAIQEKRIAIQPLQARRLYAKLLADFPLGKGEAEALALAVAGKSRLFATDDKKAIQAAKLLRIPFTTAVGILVRMAEKGVLAKREALLKLQALGKAGRYKTDIIEAAQSRLGGK